MHEFLLKIGFSRSPNEPFLHIRYLSSGITLIGLYVDYLLIAGKSTSEIQAIKDTLSHRFEMKNTSDAKVILGIEISRDRSTQSLIISQSEYTRNVLDRFGITKLKPVVTPMQKSYIEIPLENHKPAQDVPYRQAIGSLLYLMITTRLDIHFILESYHSITKILVRMIGSQ